MQSRNIIFLLSLVLLLLSCVKKEEITPMPQAGDVEIMTENETSHDSLAISYLALGDSYTIGESVAAENRYPEQLVESLIRRGINVNQLKTVARTGWTTRDLSLALDGEAINNGDYNLVSLLIGVNNQYQGLSLERFKEEFTVLLDRAIAYAGGNKDRVFVISIPDYGVTPFGLAWGNPAQIAEDIDNFNNASLEITESREVKYFDITPISREALDDRSLIASDGLHPSGKMYTRWVELMLPEVQKLLK
jgi:lysophospholipase L1-like esterase